MAKFDKQMLVEGLKRYHDCDFTPGVYEHSIIGQAALLLEKSVEVVRCKDCKRWKYDEKRMAGLCKRHINYTAKWDFCSYGERREGE